MMYNFRKRWIIKQVDEERKEEIRRKLRKKRCLVSDLVLKVLATRRDIDIEDMYSFLEPNLEEMWQRHPVLSDTQESANEILEAVNNNKKIVIVSEWDIDGMAGTTILYDFLTNELGGKVQYYTITEEDFIGEVLDMEPDLIITVGCSINMGNAKKPTDVKIIITDHHEYDDNHTYDEELRIADRIINPNKPGELCSFKSLAGSAVALKLITAICQEKDFGMERYFKYMNAVALGTITEDVSLSRVNRAIVRYGIQTPSLGISTLMKKIGISVENVYCDDIRCRLIARLVNKLENIDIEDFIGILTTRDVDEAERIASSLAKGNGFNINEREVLEVIEISDTEITLENAKKLKKLDPYGADNPVPLFFIENIRVEDAQNVTGDHLKFKFYNQNMERIDAIKFRDRYNIIRAEEIENSRVDLVFEIKRNTWKKIRNIRGIIQKKDIEQVQIHIKDIKTHEDKPSTSKEGSLML